MDILFNNMYSGIEYKFSKFASNIKLSGGINVLEGRDGFMPKKPHFVWLF